MVDVLTAAGHRHRILGLPASDADEERLEVTLRAAVADEPTLRILHVAALDSHSGPSTNRWSGCNTRSSAGHVDFSAPRLPLNSAHPSG